MALTSDASRRYISPSDLLSSLRTTLLGGASLLFGWNEETAKFGVRSDGSAQLGEAVLVLGELSEETTSRYVICTK